MIDYKKYIQDLVTNNSPHELFFFADLDGASSKKNHRLSIREKISSFLPAEDKQSILDLSAVPNLKKGFISISHCDLIGGFIFYKKPVGFDLELESRIRHEVVLRVSDNNEINSSPSPSLLWVAKEASFKFLRAFNQPKFISQIKIEWLEVGNNKVFEFKIIKVDNDFCNIPHKGFAAQVGDLVCCWIRAD